MQGKRVNLADSHRTRIRRRDGSTCGGHLLKPIERPTWEIKLSEIPDPSKRRMHKDFNIASIDVSWRTLSMELSIHFFDHRSYRKFTRPMDRKRAMILGVYIAPSGCAVFCILFHHVFGYTTCPHAAGFEVGGMM